MVGICLCAYGGRGYFEHRTIPLPHRYDVGGVSMLRPESIKVVVTNPPTKEESSKRIKQLCKFLENNWSNIPSNFNEPMILNAQAKNE